MGGGGGGDVGRELLQLVAGMMVVVQLTLLTCQDGDGWIGGAPWGLVRCVETRSS